MKQIIKPIFEIGIVDKNGIHIRLGDVVMVGIKNYKGKISGWSKEIVTFLPNDKEIGLTPFGRKQEFMQMQTDSDCLEVIIS